MTRSLRRRGSGRTTSPRVGGRPRPPYGGGVARRAVKFFGSRATQAVDLGRLEVGDAELAVADEHVIGRPPGRRHRDQPAAMGGRAGVGRVGAHQPERQAQSLAGGAADAGDETDDDGGQGRAGLGVVVAGRAVAEPGPPEASEINRHRSVPAVLVWLPVASALGLARPAG